MFEVMAIATNANNKCFMSFLSLLAQTLLWAAISSFHCELVAPRSSRQAFQKLSQSQTHVNPH